MKKPADIGVNPLDFDGIPFVPFGTDFKVPAFREVPASSATTIQFRLEFVEWPGQSPRTWTIQSGGHPIRGGRDWHVLRFRSPAECAAYLKRWHGVTMTGGA